MKPQERPTGKEVRRKRRFPWILFLLLLATAYLFWGLPYQLGQRPVQVEYQRPE